jgi:hypothetical protein
MKTAMQEMIQWIVDNQFPVNKEFVEKTIELTMKEKEQIEDAYLKGYIHYLPKIDSKEYYNQTYNQNK